MLAKSVYPAPIGSSLPPIGQRNNIIVLLETAGIQSGLPDLVYFQGSVRCFLHLGVVPFVRDAAQQAQYPQFVI